MIVISPGSRSAPLVVAAVRQEGIGNVVHFDERGAAYFALGHARANHQPTALICTSGTAVANYLPAVIEASQDRIPLVILTADRPPELRDTGANQTIIQPGLFGQYVRWQFDMPCPTTDIDPAMVLTTVDHAAFRATHSPAGPVHLNCMFREPLAPVQDGKDYDAYLSPLERWRSNHEPFTQYTGAVRAVSSPQLGTVKDLLTSASRGVIVTGRLASEDDAAAVQELARRLRWPVLPDIQSQLRLGSDSDSYISCADLILSSDQLLDTLQPDVVLHLGDQVVSKRLLNRYGHGSTAIVRVMDSPCRHDPTHRVTHRIKCSVAEFCHELPDIVDPGGSDYLGRWQRANKSVTNVLNTNLSGDMLSEPAIAHRLSRLLLSESALFLGSSLSIRNMDSFAASDGHTVVVAANRGASGIDGTIASAVGFAEGSKRPLTLLLGDLALLNDLNSLDLVRRATVPVTIVLLNNNGGAIFGLLPIAESFDRLETYFIAPHGLAFAQAAKQFGIAYYSPSNMQAFENSYHRAAGNGSAIIELPIDRHADAAFRQQLLASVRTALEAS